MDWANARGFDSEIKRLFDLSVSFSGGNDFLVVTIIILTMQNLFSAERDSLAREKTLHKLRYHNEAETCERVEKRRIDLRKINRNKELYLVFLSDS